MVTSRREGNSIFYRRALPSPKAQTSTLLLALYRQIDAIELGDTVSQRLLAIQQERGQASRQFFSDNADKFRSQQDLIASYPIYAEAVSEFLNHTPLPHKERALEVGPGQGEFLAQLSPHFKQVIALDNSQSMLNQAQGFAAQKKITNIEFICGDTAMAREQLANVDCAVINMVLHHVPSPASIFDDVSALLRPGAALLLCDLCHHDQEWAREACGDVWLGFEPDDISSWAMAAGLEEGQSQYLACAMAKSIATIF